MRPVFPIIIEAVVLGETLRPVQTLGILIVLLAIVIVQMPDRVGREATIVVEPIVKRKSRYGAPQVLLLIGIPGVQLPLATTSRLPQRATMKTLRPKSCRAMAD
jgi:hypothetical protein